MPHFFNFKSINFNVNYDYRYFEIFVMKRAANKKKTKKEEREAVKPSTQNVHSFLKCK